MARKIGVEQGMAALQAYARSLLGEDTGSEGGDGEISAGEKRLAVRFALQEFAERHPGHAVEIRVPYAGAVQAIEGVNHRRGTPPNVVEMDQDTFLKLILGLEAWEAAMDSGKISASGTRADLREFLPMYG